MPERTHLAVAVFDMETSSTPPGTVIEPDAVRFLTGVIRWLHVVRVQGKPSEIPQYHVGTLAENVYFDPAAMADDLLRPWSHAIVAWRGAQFDVPILAAQAAGPTPGPYLNNPRAADVVAVSRHLGAFGQESMPLCRVERRNPPVSPRGLWQELVAGIRTKRLRSRWLSSELERAVGRYAAWHREYSEIRPPGVVSLRSSRQAIEERLQAKLFDPWEWMTHVSGSTGNPCHLDYLREGLSGPNGAPAAWTLADGSEPDKGQFEAMWSEGHAWEIIDCCKHDVNLLSQVLHVGLHGHLTANRLGDPAARTMWKNHREGGTWPFVIETKAWWHELETIKAAALSRAAEEARAR